MKKIILGVIILLLIFAAFYIIKDRKQTENSDTTNNELTPSITTSEENEELTVSGVINGYYLYYENCMKNPPEEASGRVGEYCQINSGLTTDSFAENLEKGGTAKAGADPIVCAQDFPEKITVTDDIQIINNNATGYVDEKLGSNTLKPKLELVRENDVWKIDNIICPEP